MERYVAHGDRAAFEAIFQRYAKRLHGLFMRQVGSREAAGDLVQQTFLHFHRARADFKGGRKVRPWLYTIALNVRREHHRKKGRKPEVAHDPVVHGEPTVGPSTSTRTDRLVRRALAELSEQQREVIVLHYYEDLSFPEIADLLGASVSAVKVRAHRGYERLREMLGDERG
ncbi:MAG: RNA polymerase sigma factor [Deltaproteobacteria bacterium]|nr:MAG: RNA polymerase sigma factor [Deltaproteobacteria bacterium]